MVIEKSSFSTAISPTSKETIRLDRTLKKFIEHFSQNAINTANWLSEIADFPIIGRGLKAKSDIQVGDVIVSVPLDTACVNLKTVIEDSMVKRFFDQAWPSGLNFTTLELLIIFLCAVKRKEYWGLNFGN